MMLTKAERLERAKREHEKALHRLGVRPRKKTAASPVPFPNLYVGRVPTEDKIPGCVPRKRSVMEAVLRGSETGAAAAGILDKAKRIAPLFNKGGHQFITEGADPTTIGRKI